MRPTGFARSLCLFATASALACGDDTTSTSASDSGSTSGSSTDTTSGDASTSDETDSVGGTTTSSSSGPDSTSTSADSSSSSGVAADTGSDSSSAGSESSGDASTGSTGGELTGCYDPNGHPYGGTLCGPGGAPCEVSEQVVDPISGFRNGSPSITHDGDCSPQVFYSFAEGGFTGTLAVRDGDGGWTLNVVPEAVARPGVVFNAAEETTQLVMDDGAFGVHHYTWDGAFGAGETLDGQHGIRSQGVAGIGDGVLEIGLSTPTGSAAVYGTFDGGWSTSAVQDDATWIGAEVSATGDPQLSFWSSAGGSWAMFWHDPLADVTEEVVAHGSGVLGEGTNILGIIDDAPQILLALTQPNGLLEVAVASRQAADDWAVDSIVAEDPTGEQTCGLIPNVAGQTCDFDFVRYRPLGLVVSQGGDVRAYYAEDHNIGTLVSECFKAPFPMCFWSPMSDESEYTVFMAAPSGDGAFESQPLISDRRVLGMDTSLDAFGVTHVAAYVADGDGSSVSYFSVE